MRIAITASRGSLDSDVDPHFGRSRYFIVVDDAANGTEIVDNRGSDDLPHGAGIEAVAKLVARGVDGVLTGQVGPKAEQGLRAAGIAVRTGVSGRCRDAVAAFLAAPRG